MRCDAMQHVKHHVPVYIAIYAFTCMQAAACGTTIRLMQSVKQCRLMPRVYMRMLSQMNTMNTQLRMHRASLIIYISDAYTAHTTHTHTHITCI